MKPLLFLLVLVGGFGGLTAKKYTYEDLANTRAQLHLDVDKILVPTYNEKIERWHLQALPKNSPSISRALVKILHATNEGGHWFGFQSAHLNNTNLRTGEKTTKKIFKNEIIFQEKNFLAPEQWKLIQAPKESSYHLQNRFTGGYLCITKQPIAYSSPLITDEYLKKINDHLKYTKASFQTNAPHILSRFDVTIYCFLNPGKTCKASRALHKYNDLTKKEPITTLKDTAWTSLEKRVPVYDFTHNKQVRALKVTAKSVPEQNKKYFSSDTPLTDITKSTKIKIEIDPNYQISLSDLKKLSGKTVRIKSSRTGKYFRVIKKGRKNVLKTDLDNPKNRPEAEFKIIGPVNAEGGYWIGLQTKNAHNVRGIAGSNTVDCQDKKFHKWTHWELSGKSLNKCYLRHRIIEGHLYARNDSDPETDYIARLWYAATKTTARGKRSTIKIPTVRRSRHSKLAIEIVS